MSPLGGFKSLSGFEPPSPTSQFSPEEIKFISSNPIMLDVFRTSIPPNINDFSAYIASTRTDRDAKSLFGQLINTLAFNPSAEALFLNSDESFSMLLIRFLMLWSQQRILPEKLIDRCSSLLEKVASNRPDPDVWIGVYELLEEFSRTPPEAPPQAPPQTPPKTPDSAPNPAAKSALKPATLDTPARPNTATNQTESQIRDELDPYLRLELTGAVYTNAHGFGTRFGEPDLSAYWECAAKCGSQCAKRTKCPTEWGWNEDIVHLLPLWPENPSEEAVMKWFGKFNDRISKQRRFYGSGHKELGDSKCKRKCDVFLSPTILNNQNQPAFLPPKDRHSWCNVLVPGELKSNPSEDGKAELYLQLASYVREVFGAQCGRRYIHAFSICGDIMRCYIFDRGGGSISHSFSIGKNLNTFRLFVQILRSYVEMSPALLGFDPTIQTESGEVFLPIKQNLALPMFVTICGRRFQLLNVLFHQSAIVSRGTTCWIARDDTGEDCVVKDAWRSHLRQSEGKLFAQAQENGVRGLPDCRLYEDVKVDNILDDLHENVRKGLTYAFSKVVIFPQKQTDKSWGASFDTSRAGTSRVSRLILTEKGEDDDDNNTGRTPSTSRWGRLKNIKKGKDTEADLVSSTSKLSLGQRLFKKSPVGEKPNDSIERQVKDGNRIHTRLVFYTIGREIYRFRSTQELLEAFHGAITCHKSLVQDGEIIHRDVSINNIMIANNPRNGELKGFLIDLDMAKAIGSDSSGATNRTGTMEFMAINVLRQSEPHSYRDDLESFFYVLIWICVMFESTGDRHYILDAENKKRPPLVLDAWISAHAADVKELQMIKELRFQGILDGFSDGFQELGSMMKEIRQALFPSQGGMVAAESEEKEQDRLYGALLGPIQRQLNKMSK